MVQGLNFSLMTEEDRSFPFHAWSTDFVAPVLETEVVDSLRCRV